MPTARARGMDSMCDRARRQKRVSASFFAVLVAVCVGPAACPAGLVDRRTVCLPAPWRWRPDGGRRQARHPDPRSARRTPVRSVVPSVLKYVLATTSDADGTFRAEQGGCGGVPDKWFIRLVGSDIAKRQHRSMSNYAVSLGSVGYRFTLFCLFTGPARRDAQRDAGRQSGLPPPPAP